MSSQMLEKNTLDELSLPKMGVLCTREDERFALNQSRDIKDGQKYSGLGKIVAVTLVYLFFKIMTVPNI